VSDRILILGGTREAAHLAQTLSATHDVITSLAGRTKEPKPLAGDMRIGGFGGVEPMAQWLIDNQIDRDIDALTPSPAKFPPMRSRPAKSQEYRSPFNNVRLGKKSLPTFGLKSKRLIRHAMLFQKTQRFSWP